MGKKNWSCSKWLINHYEEHFPCMAKIVDIPEELHSEMPGHILRRWLKEREAFGVRTPLTEENI